MAADEPTAAVLDFGSWAVKCGISGDNAPSCGFPNLVGRGKASADALIAGKGAAEPPAPVIGNAAAADRGGMYVTSPMDRGLVADYEDLERVFHHALVNELKVVPEEHAVVVAHVPLAPHSQRVKMAVLALEALDMPRFYAANTGVLSLYSSGRTAGVVVELGHGCSSIMPIHEGAPVPAGVRRVPLGGQDIAAELNKLIAGRGHVLAPGGARHVLWRILEEHGYVAGSAEEAKTARGKSGEEAKVEYALPDGGTLRLGGEVYRAPEHILFRSSKPDGTEYEGLGGAVRRAISKCDPDVRPEMYSGLVLAGGTSLYRGMPERLRLEVEEVAHEGISRVRVQASADRKNAAWVGASILSNLSTFDAMYVTRAEWDEWGDSIIKRKIPV